MFPRRGFGIRDNFSLLGAITPRIHVRSRDEIRAKTPADLQGSMERDWADSLLHTSHTQFHYNLDASFSNVVVQVAARARSALLAVISPFTALRFIGGIQCVMYSRASIREPVVSSSSSLAGAAYRRAC